MIDHASMAYTIPEAVSASKVSRTEIYAALQRGDLNAKKNGRRTLILKQELDRFLTSLPDYQAAA